MVDKSNNVLSLCLVAKFDIISHRINQLTYRYITTESPLSLIKVKFLNSDMQTRLTCISSEPASVMTALDTCTDSKRTNTLSTTGMSLVTEDDEPLAT